VVGSRLIFQKRDDRSRLARARDRARIERPIKKSPPNPDRTLHPNLVVKQIVDQDNLFAPNDGVDMEFHLCFAVPRLIFQLGFVGQTSFSVRYKANSEFSDSRSKQSPSNNSDDLVDFLPDGETGRSTIGTIRHLV